MDWPSLYILRSRLVIYRLSEKIEDSTQTLVTNRYSDWASCVFCINATNKTVCGTHGNAANYVVTDLLSNLSDKSAILYHYLYSVVKIRKFTLFKADVKYRACNLNYLSNMIFTHCFTP